MGKEVAMNQDDIEYLQNLRHDWWKSEETPLIVGRILADYGILHSPSLAFDFVEKPWKWQRDIDELLKEWKHD